MLSDTAGSLNRVVVLCNSNLHTRSTVATLINSDVNVVGYVEAASRRTPRRIVNTVKRNGLIKTANRFLSKCTYSVLHWRRDARIYNVIFNRDIIERTLVAWAGPSLTCKRYGEPRVLDWISSLDPDVIVVHSGNLVSKSVRGLARSGLVIGGHPGLTPRYRGGNSSFWALYYGKPQDVGWTVFKIDSGVDTGEVVSQGYTPIQKNDSFHSLDWKGMVQIAQEQARLIKQLDSGKPVVTRGWEPIPENSLLGYPTLVEYLKYRYRQRLAR